MATIPLARARARVAGWRSMRTNLGVQAAFWSLALLLLFTSGPPPPEIRIRQMAASRAFPLVDWDLARLVERGDRIVLGLLGARPEPTAADQSAAAGYFSTRPSERQSLAPAAEAAIERAVSGMLWQEGLTSPAPWASTGAILFPPVSFTFTAPPEVLIVARRDLISVVQSELLQPGISDAEAERLEADTDALGFSSLVIEIGGLATYPTMVVENTSPLDAVVAVTHEWIHGYLFFTPLGRLYWSSQEARTINETAAEMVSRELGPRVMLSLGLESTSVGDGRSSADRLTTFRTMMRETRVELDALLRAGRIDEAEAYLGDRRHEFVAAGFKIRKLNQAYFAFHGSYGDAAAGRNPIPRQLAWLRATSSSPREFLRQVGQITSAQELTRAVGE